MIERPDKSLGEDYFQRIYAQEADPWQFETSPYEQKKYQRTLACLPREKYARCLEIGCSIGVLTALLAERCEELVATEINDRALAKARERLQHEGKVELLKLNFPQEQPEGSFDLVVLSELAYYWAAADFAYAQQLIVTELLRPKGHLLLVHYTPVETDYPMTGDEVHDRYLALSRGKGAVLKHIDHYRADRYRLDLFELVV